MERQRRQRDLEKCEDGYNILEEFHHLENTLVSPKLPFPDRETASGDHSLPPIVLRKIVEIMAIRISHLGIAVKDLAASEALFRTLLGDENVHHETVEDQGVKIASLKVGESVIELTEASRPDSPIAGFLEKRGEGIHHLAIEVDDVRYELDRLKAAGIKLIDEHPRPGAHDMLIAFLHPKSTNGVLIELCQTNQTKSPT
jgi:methylmalonyl-CoA/ethylmalonyl-CoA epimerase